MRFKIVPLLMFSLLILLSSTEAQAAAKVYLPVTFLCQAPDGNWDEPWQNACEEASIIMAMHYVKGDALTRESGRQEILSLVAFQEKNYGGHFDLTAEQAVKLINDYYKFDQVELRTKFTVNDIKEELSRGNIVIAPMAGRLLGNPFYTPPGPVYHYMLFKGFDDRTGQFITNDCGTRRGSNYRYKYSVAYNAIHDWTGEHDTITLGGKAMIVVKLK